MDNSVRWYANGKIVSATAVTPNDTTAIHFEGVWVGVGGDVAVKFKDDSAAVTLKNVASGEMIIGCIKAVMSTNTTATNIIGVRIHE